MTLVQNWTSINNTSYVFEKSFDILLKKNNIFMTALQKVVHLKLMKDWTRSINPMTRNVHLNVHLI
jgi:hypothetical protein